MRVEDLRPLAIFEGVSDDRLAQLVAVGEGAMSIYLVHRYLATI